MYAHIGRWYINPAHVSVVEELPYFVTIHLLSGQSCAVDKDIFPDAKNALTAVVKALETADTAYSTKISAVQGKATLDAMLPRTKPVGEQG